MILAPGRLDSRNQPGSRCQPWCQIAGPAPPAASEEYWRAARPGTQPLPPDAARRPSTGTCFRTRRPKPTRWAGCPCRRPFPYL